MLLMQKIFTFYNSLWCYFIWCFAFNIISVFNRNYCFGWWNKIPRIWLCRKNYCGFIFLYFLKLSNQNCSKGTSFKQNFLCWLLTFICFFNFNFSFFTKIFWSLRSRFRINLQSNYNDFVLAKSTHQK